MLGKHDLGSGRESARTDRTVQVWDPLVRLIHWGVVLMVVINAAIVAKDSPLHLWAGYTMLVLVGVRLLWGIIGSPPVFGLPAKSVPGARLSERDAPGRQDRTPVPQPPGSLDGL